jgi:cytochrome c biogenesis protein CcmG/thiol:disulfide interchange protein DsbE
MRAAVFLIAVVLAGGAHPALAALPSELGEIKGTVVWVDFWASWCAPCRRSFPWMNKMQTKYAAQGLQIIAVNVDTERAKADQFLRENAARFDVKFDPKGQLAEAYDVQAMPSSYLMDADGNVLQTHLGFRLDDTDEYESQIKAALAARQ